MGSKYLTDLAQVCRSTGAVVHEQEGWQRRAKASGGYNPGCPTHVMCHHTASNASSDGQSDVDFMCYRSPNKPVANLYLSRKAEIWVMAAGASNTNGLGHDSWGGGVPANSMNSYAIGIEAANNGIGEPWPIPMQTMYVKLVAALCSHYRIPNNQVRAHFEWAPTRKIDPAGQSKYASGSNKWDMRLFRNDCNVTVPVPPKPPLTPGTYVGDDVSLAIASNDGTDVQKAAVFAVNLGISIGHMVDQEYQDVGLVTGTVKFDGNGKPFRNFNAAQIQGMIDRCWVGGPKPAGWK